MLNADVLRELILGALEEVKAFDIVTLDVRRLTDVTDLMIFASGGSDRQVKAIARNVVDRLKAQGQPAMGLEGERDGEWILIDLYDVIVHVMLPRVRDFYQLEKLWSGGDQSASTKP